MKRAAVIAAALGLAACSGGEPDEVRWTDYAAVVGGLVRAELSKPRGVCRGADIDPVWSEAAARMGDKDQHARSGVSNEEWIRLDAENRAELSELLAARGWPEPCALTSEAATGLLYVVQHHTDPAVRREALPHFEAMARTGRLRRDELALVIDRILVNQDRPQRFGTQYGCNGETGLYERGETEDPAGLDARRRAMGLMPGDVELRLINARNTHRRCERRRSE